MTKDPNLKEIKNLIDQAKKQKLGWGVKFTKKSGCCYACESNDYKKVIYKVGKEIELKDAPKNGDECNTGIHLGKSFIGAGNYHIPEKIFFCTYKKSDICGEGDDKIRVRKTKVVKSLPIWLGYGPNGKKVLNKLNKKLDLKKYNPYKATKLPDKSKLGFLK